MVRIRFPPPLSPSLRGPADAGGQSRGCGGGLGLVWDVREGRAGYDQTSPGRAELYEPRGRVAFDRLIRAVEKSPSAAKRIRLLRAISDTRPNGGFPPSPLASRRQAWCQNQFPVGQRGARIAGAPSLARRRGALSGPTSECSNRHRRAASDDGINLQPLAAANSRERLQSARASRAVGRSPACAHFRWYRERGRPLPVEPHVLKAPAVEDAVNDKVEILDARPPAGPASLIAAAADILGQG
jgi:hypothetical protein